MTGRSIPSLMRAIRLVLHARSNARSFGLGAGGVVSRAGSTGLTRTASHAPPRISVPAVESSEIFEQSGVSMMRRTIPVTDKFAFLVVNHVYTRRAMRTPRRSINILAQVECVRPLLFIPASSRARRMSVGLLFHGCICSGNVPKLKH